MWERALALKQLYGVPLALDNSKVFLSRTLPELWRFVSFLTEVDLRFKVKMARYYEQRKRFKAKQSSKILSKRSDRIVWSNFDLVNIGSLCQNIWSLGGAFRRRAGEAAIGAVTSHK
jgi:hypothetical protein